MFSLECFLVSVSVENMALRQMTDSGRRANSIPKTPVPLQPLLTWGPKAAAAPTHPWWLSTCGLTGWLQALLLILPVYDSNFFISSFYQCFCGTIEISKHITEVFLVGIKV